MTASLQTRDRSTADEICRDLQIICDDRELWENPTHPRLVTLHHRAVEIFFGEKSDAAAYAREQRELLDHANVESIIGNVVRAGRARSDGRPLLAVVAQLVAREMKETNDRAARLERELAEKTEQLHNALSEVTRLSRAQNKHVRVTIAEAARAWYDVYQMTHPSQTHTKVWHGVSEFSEFLADKGATPLGEIRAHHINDWMDSLAHRQLAPPTRQRYKAYLSVFLSWAVVKYDLSENPIGKTLPVGGADRHPENILALRRLEDHTTLLEGLKPWPYWRAWVATALLAGPRYGEQSRMMTDSVFLDENYLRIATLAPGPHGPQRGTKTGRERNVPIEQTVLKEILAEHVAVRRKSRDGFPWLFPSLLETPEWLQDRKTPAGQWSSHRNFLDAWSRPVAEICAGYFERGEAPPDYWGWGPDEWRHSFGTALGMCGWQSLEIARVMGNTEGVCRRHYVAASSAGSRWPYRW